MNFRYTLFIDIAKLGCRTIKILVSESATVHYTRFKFHCYLLE